MARAQRPHEERNRIVAQHYKENAGKYEKTLVFAINVQHAASLTGTSRSGVSAQYVASYRPDGANDEGLGASSSRKARWNEVEQHLPRAEVSQI